MSLLAALRAETAAAWRRCFARPLLALLTLGVLTIGVGAAGFMFAVVDAAQLRALPFRAADRLQLVSYQRESDPGEWEALRARDFSALSQRDDVFEHLGGMQRATISLSDAAGAERFAGARVTAGLFTALGIAPALGRDLAAADQAAGTPRAVLLSDALWRTRFGADPQVLGRALKVNQQAGVVVGVMPPGFGFPFSELVWMPVDDPAGAQAQAEDQELVAFGILRVGVTAEAAGAALAPTFVEQARADPPRYAGVALGLTPAALYFVDPQTRAFQQAMLAAVLGLLLIAVANAAALGATDAVARRHELAVRVALGASRARLLLGEALHALLLGGGAAALALAGAALALEAYARALRTVEDPSPYWLAFELTPRVIAIVVAAASLAALASRLLPAWSATAQASQGLLRDSERGSVGRGLARTLSWLLALQVALSCCLVVGTMVLVQGMVGMWTRDIGADPRGVLTARVALLGPAYEDPAARAQFHERLGVALSGLPGVRSAGVGSALPGSTHDEDPVAVRGDAAELPAPAAWGAVDAGYAATLGLRLRDGRLFDARDAADGAPVAIVDARFAAERFPGGDALGREIRLEPADPDSVWRTVVGVVEPVLYAEVDDQELPALLVPLAQHPRRFVTVALKTDGDPMALAAPLRAALRALDPDAPLYWVRTHQQAIAHGRSTAALITALFTAVGAIALALAAAGTYGVIAGAVARREREVGVRRALGADGAAVLRAVAAPTLTCVGLGLGVGMLLAVPLGRALAGLAPGLLHADPLTLLAVLAAVLAAAALGLGAPLARALRIEPAVALREE